MSAELVGWALTVPGLNYRARVVLLAMCHQARAEAKGDVPAATYYGGWSGLAVVLDPDQHMRPEARRLAVARSVSELVDRGLVKRVDNDYGGPRAWYRIRP